MFVSMPSLIHILHLINNVTLLLIVYNISEGCIRLLPVRKTWLDGLVAGLCGGLGYDINYFRVKLGLIYWTAVDGFARMIKLGQGHGLYFS